MKIAYIALSIIPSRTANSIHVMNICSSLARQGHDVTLLVPAYQGQSQIDDSVFSYYGVEKNFSIEKLSFPETKGKTLIYTFSIYSKLKRLKPDHVVGRFVNGCAIASYMGISTTFDSHGPIWENGKFSLWLFKRMIQRKSFKRLTVNSASLKRLYQEAEVAKVSDFDYNEIVVAYNGANSYKLDEDKPLPGLAGRLKVGYFGHLYPGRGIDIILELAKRTPHINYYVVGGEEKDIAYWKEEVSLANLFFIGHVPFSEVYKYRNACDILLAPYQSVIATAGGKGDQSKYMNPIKIIEYMSSQKAIISSKLPTIMEVLDDSNSLLVDAGDIEAWILAIGMLESDELLRKRISSSAYQNFLSNFTWENRARILILEK